MFWKQNGKYYQYDMGHCSCFSWDENLDTEQGFNSIEALIENSSESIEEGLKPFLALLKEVGLS